MPGVELITIMEIGLVNIPWLNVIRHQHSEWKGIFVEANYEVGVLTLFYFASSIMNSKTKVHTVTMKIYIPTMPNFHNAIFIYTFMTAHAVTSGLIAFPICVHMKNYLTTKPNLDVHFVLEFLVEFPSSLCSFHTLYFRSIRALIMLQ